MAMRIGLIMSILSLAAAGVAAYAISQVEEGPRDADVRLADLEERLSRIETLVREGGVGASSEPMLRGSPPEGLVVVEEPSTSAVRPGASDPATEAGTSGAGPVPEEALRELVDEAVDAKAAQLRAMEDKKPPLKTFARTLELTEAQRAAAEEEIRKAQWDIREVLEIPADDGTRFLDELVEVFAHGMAAPGKDPGRGMRFFGRLMTENVPGTNQTYAARAEEIKQRVRDSFRRDWSDEQYARFEAWGVDPTEVEGIEGGAWGDLERRVIDRAKDLGADLPDEE